MTKTTMDEKEVTVAVRYSQSKAQKLVDDFRRELKKEKNYKELQKAINTIYSNMYHGYQKNE